MASVSRDATAPRRGRNVANSDTGSMVHSTVGASRTRRRFQGHEEFSQQTPEASPFTSG